MTSIRRLFFHFLPKFSRFWTTFRAVSQTTTRAIYWRQLCSWSTSPSTLLQNREILLQSIIFVANSFFSVQYLSSAVSQFNIWPEQFLSSISDQCSFHCEPIRRKGKYAWNKPDLNNYCWKSLFSDVAFYKNLQSNWVTNFDKYIL